jgi:hypothetical protein
MHRRRGRSEIEDFDLLVWKAPKGYQARVREREEGREAHGDFTDPFQKENPRSTIEHEEVFRDLRISKSETGDFARKIGTSLFQAVFAGEILVSWNLHLIAAKKNGKRLRLRLHLLSPDLWDWPWELLCDPKRDFLAVLPETPVVRYVEMLDSIRPLRVRPPIRVLAVSACPAGVSPLAVHEEHEDLERSLAELCESERVELDRLEGTTRAALRNKLQEKSFHILHFIGHGLFDESGGGGAILLEGEEGEMDRVNGQELSALLGTHPQLRLVVLNACSGARGDRSDPFAGLVQSLIKGRLPAVVAMRSAVPDRMAILFSRTFYESLAKREPVDLAVSRARNAMFSERATAEWGSPVLAMRTPDGRIFDFFWWEILIDELVRIKKRWKYCLSALVLLALLGTGLWELGKRWFDRNLLFAFFNPPECPSPPDLPIAFVKIAQGSSPPICMSRFEVTQRLWRRVMGKIRSRRRGDALPVVRVSWHGANAFVAKLGKLDPQGGYRIPSGREWMSAARAGGQSLLTSPTETANCNNKEANDGYEDTAPVGSFPSNASGLYDMVGNVSEWVSDSDKSGTKRVRLGGSFENVPSNCTVGYSTSSKPETRYPSTGFRIVRDVTPPP